MMMRASSGIVCAVAGALSFAVACSWGGASSGSDASVSSSTRCGDGVCAASEVSSCPADCGTGSNGSGSNTGSNTGAVCGNGTCENGETNTSCPSDCTGGGSGSATGNCPADLTPCFSCIVDPTMCPTGLDSNSCLACIIGGLGSADPNAGCDGGAPDGVCQTDETNAICPADCP